MFSLSKLFTAFLLPPGLFVLLFGLVFLLLLAGRKRAGAVVGLLSLLLVYGLSIQPVADGLLLPLEDGYPPLLEPRLATLEAQGALSDAIVVVLGGGSVDRSPEEGLHASLSPDPAKRLDYGIGVAARLHAGLVFTGGSVWRDGRTETEADAARRYVQKHAPSLAAVYEDRSRTTLENAIETKKLVGPKTVVLVTSAYHMRRSVAVFEKKGMKVIAAPTDYKVNRSGRAMRDFLPSMNALENSFEALHEYFGMLGYLFAR
jgi:uncharacterized SAM-binding protein YcdF (DUF218 family)